MLMPRLARRIGWVVVPILLAACSNGRGSLQEQEGQAPPASGPAQGTFAVGGTVAGMRGSGLVLQNNGADDLTVNADGTFSFATRAANAAAYSVTVRTPPAGQNCVVQNASGTISNADVTNVQVSCAANQFTVGGTVTGLSGTGLKLQLNGGGELAIVSDGPFAFPMGLADGASYTATVLAPPSNPSQECTLANGSGAIAGANVTNITITCATRSFTIGGTISGLASTGLAVRLNGTQDLPIMGNGNFTFPTAIPSGTSYTVTVIAQPASPPLQVCTAANAAGTVRDANVTNVTVSCATQTFSVGGTVSGLLGSGLRLRNSNERIDVAANGTFVFPTKVASGANFAVTVDTAPSNPTQACTIANGTGTIVAADITTIQISCSTSTFTVGGTAHNLIGSGLILRNNGADDLLPTSSGPFTFATAILSGAAYDVTVAQQPTSPSQTCTVENASGTVGGGAVSNIQVRCETNGYLVGGNVTGLLGTGLQIQNGTDTLTIAADGPFRFPTALLSGATYYVHVPTMPSAPAQSCIVLNGIGLITNQDISNIEVRCQIAPQF